MNWLVGVIGFFVMLFVGAIWGSRNGQKDAKVLDLMNKIKEKKDWAAKEKEIADAKRKEYDEALKKYDPNFDDDGDDKPSA